MKGTETRTTEKYGISWTQKTTVEELLNSIKAAVNKAYAAGKEAGRAEATEITAEEEEKERFASEIKRRKSKRGIIKKRRRRDERLHAYR